MTQDYLKTILDYNPNTGIFVWKIITMNNAIGDVAGSIIDTVDGYRYMRISHNNKKYKSHRLAFLYMIGSIPERIDHKDRNSLNNKWDNLRESTATQNCQNSTIQKNNTSGYTGVHFQRKNKKWVARIVVDGKRKALGCFLLAKDAAITHNIAAKKYFGEYPNLNIIKGN